MTSVVLAALLGLFIQTAPAEDLPTDPRILTGKCANGATWMYQRHANPPGKMSLMFHVSTGSLMEKDSQRGLAHFTEHMVFNGSENFPPGDLMPYFESIGMEFGGDINAFTSFDQTGFMIFLPNTEIAEIDKALMVLSDQAFRCLFLDEEIEKERGVILAEMRAGRGPQQRLRDKIWPVIFAGSRFAVRMVLGTEEVITNAKRDDFIDYYKTWFRPERLTVMLVGDADPAPIIPLIEKWFGQYTPEVPAREEPGAQFKMFKQQQALTATDPELSACSVQMFNLLPVKPPTTTVEQARDDLIGQIGEWIFARRLDDRVNKGEASYQSAFASAFGFYNEATLVMGAAEGEPDKWEPMLEELIVEISRARQYGFTPGEFELAKKELISDAERAVKTEPTRNARGIVRRMSAAVNDKEPIMSAAQELELTTRLLPTITLQEVSDVFARHMTPGTFAYDVELPEKEGVIVPPDEEILAAARAAWARQVEPLEQKEAATDLLAAEPTPGKIVETTADDELAITHFWLDNGARVHYRFMDYKKNQIFMTISFGGARLEETAVNAGVTEVAALAINQAATKRLSSTEIRDLLTGKDATVRADFAQDTLALVVNGSPEDIEQGLRLAHALMTEGKIEDSAFKNWVETSLQRHESFSKNPQFVAIKTLLEAMSGDDPRVTMKDPERIKAQSIARSQAWLERLFREAPIEVAVVGDVKPEQIMPLVEKYVGSLPKRSRSAEKLDHLRKLNRKAERFVRTIEVDTITPQAVAFCGMIGADARDVSDAKALELAGKILDSRLIKRVREELGLIYSIGVQVDAAEVYSDAGMFITGAPCAPEKAEELVNEIEAIFQAMTDVGPTEEELANAIKQVQNNLDTRMKEPTFWWGELEHADLHKKDLNELKGLKESYAEFTAEQVRDAFRKYYVPERQMRIIATPATVEAPLGASE